MLTDTTHDKIKKRWKHLLKKTATKTYCLVNRATIKRSERFITTVTSVTTHKTETIIDLNATIIIKKKRNKEKCL